jgi:hypothetical protein
MTDPDFVKVDFILHCEVLIDAAPAVVWRSLSRAGEGLGAPTLVPVGGPRGELGERFHAIADSAPVAPPTSSKR